VAFLEGNNLVVFYNISASNIWPDKRGGLCWEGPYKRETAVALFSKPTEQKGGVIKEIPIAFATYLSFLFQVQFCV
jgi:hypothetical protein